LKRGRSANAAANFASATTTAPGRAGNSPKDLGKSPEIENMNSLPHGFSTSPWRDHLPVHKLADEYPKVPHDRLIEIGESIRRSGLEFPILINAKGDPGNPEAFELFDGVTRLNSMVAVGIKFEFERLCFARGSSMRGNHSLRLVIHDVPTNPDLLSTTKIFHNLSDAEIAEKIEIANLHRRDLEPEQYRARIEASHARIEAAIRQNPEKSDRAHAEEQGVSDKTIAKVRKSTAEGSAVEGKRIGKDGKARKQPAITGTGRGRTRILAIQRQTYGRPRSETKEPVDLLRSLASTLDLYTNNEFYTPDEICAVLPAKVKAAVGLDPMAFVDAPLAEQTKYLDAIGAKALLAALPLGMLAAVRAWVTTHDARPAPAAPAANSDELGIPLCPLRAPPQRLN
jgi:hypothetical protein